MRGAAREERVAADRAFLCSGGGSPLSFSLHLASALHKEGAQNVFDEEMTQASINEWIWLIYSTG